MLILVTGGSGSGKSEYAEQLVLEYQKKPYLYIATMYPFDEECHRRIARHHAMRKEKEFDTLECYTGLKKADASGYGTVLLECMSNLTANELYQKDGSGKRCVEEILLGIDRLKAQCEHLIVVSNEIFSDGIWYEKETREYQQYLGEINRQLAERADKAVEVVYSIPILYKGDKDTG